VVSKHEHVRQVLNDPSFSANRLDPDFPTFDRVSRPPPPEDDRNILMMDPPERGAARRAVLGEFTVRRIAALRPQIQQITDDLIDAMLAGPKPADLVEALAVPVPSMVICELLGVPYADHTFSRQTQPRDNRQHDFARDPRTADEPGAARRGTRRPGQNARRGRGDAALLHHRRHRGGPPLHERHRNRWRDHPGRRRRPDPRIRGQP
jgi:cytochrome P450